MHRAEPIKRPGTAVKMLMRGTRTRMRHHMIMLTTLMNMGQRTTITIMRMMTIVMTPRMIILTDTAMITIMVMGTRMTAPAASRTRITSIATTTASRPSA